ncbi:HU family DNA-binding protein [uncultured Bacteroides sp.]|uniref:HU family DNA-binding protein n=1 Tax=uncultured Bacteroides sp. TaxID=162156 RepID=UPI00262E744E|nr:HU family DNA-binding protein [uncultured Bacteroides sp.]
MDDKLTIEKIAACLAAKLNMEQTDAQAFVCSFIALIEEGLRRDKYVRVKGFGTFKLIDTDLNEGRIVFVPEASIRDAVNKPFSHFEPVELGESVHFDDVEEEESISVAEEITTATDNVEVHDEPVSEKQCEVQCEVKSSGDIVENNTAEKTDVVEEISQNDEKSFQRKGGMHWYLLAAILLVGIVIGCGIMWGVLSHKVKSAKVMEVGNNVTEIEPVIGIIDTIEKDSSLVINEEMRDTASATRKTIDSIIKVTTENKNEIKYLSDEVPYKISGTIEEYTISKGSTLSKVAYRYYKNRKLWPYIVMHNKDVIQDPNNVPIGTVLRIPVLTPVD